MPPTNHAARLREMAEYQLSLVRSYENTAPRVSAGYGRNAAALLAGAEALEAVEKLRAFADELTAQNTPVLHGMAYQVDRLLPKEPTS